MSDRLRVKSRERSLLCGTAGCRPSSGVAAGIGGGAGSRMEETPFAGPAASAGIKTTTGGRSKCFSNFFLGMIWKVTLERAAIAVPEKAAAHCPVMRVMHRCRSRRAGVRSPEAYHRHFQLTGDGRSGLTGPQALTAAAASQSAQPSSGCALWDTGKQH